MNASELAAARIELGLSQDELARDLAVKPDVLRRWEDGSRSVPRSTEQVVAWLLDGKRREKAVNASGLPECPTIRQWHLPDAIEERDDRLRNYQELTRHLQSCPTCLARQKYLDDRFGPAKPMPFSGKFSVVAAVAAVMRASELLPEWTRPAFLGAVLLLGIVLFRMVFAIPVILARHVRFELRPLLLGLAGAAAGGAIGGFGYSLVGKPLRRVPIAGPYLAGIVTIGSYCFGLALLAPVAFGEPLIKERSDAYIFAVVSVLFGLIAGHSWFRSKSTSAARKGVPSAV